MLINFKTIICFCFFFSNHCVHTVCEYFEVFGIKQKTSMKLSRLRGQYNLGKKKVNLCIETKLYKHYFKVQV